MKMRESFVPFLSQNLHCLPWGARGRRFESCRSNYILIKSMICSSRYPEEMACIWYKGRVEAGFIDTMVSRAFAHSVWGMGLFCVNFDFHIRFLTYNQAINRCLIQHSLGIDVVCHPFPPL